MSTTWRETVTVYSRSMDPSGIVTWKRRVYSGCFWRENTGVANGGGSIAQTASRAARLPRNAVVFTGDIAVRGLVPDSIDEYTAGKRSTDLLKRYDCAFVVSAVHDNAGIGRPCPHIYIEGA